MREQRRCRAHPCWGAGGVVTRSGQAGAPAGGFTACAVNMRARSPGTGEMVCKHGGEH